MEQGQRYEQTCDICGDAVATKKLNEMWICNSCEDLIDLGVEEESVDEDEEGGDYE